MEECATRSGRTLSRPAHRRSASESLYESTVSGLCTLSTMLRMAFSRSYALRHRMVHLIQSVAYYILAEVLEPNWVHVRYAEPYCEYSPAQSVVAVLARESRSH